MRNIAERRVLRRAAHGPIAPLVHILEPRAVHHIDVAPRVRLRVEAPSGQRAALVHPGVVERGQDLLRDGQGDVRDVEERVREGRRGELVVLRERPRVDVEALRARVRDHDVRDRAARVVRGERVGHRLAEEGEERVVRGVGHPAARKGGKGRELRSGHGSVGQGGNLLADGVVLGSDTELGAQVEGLRELIKAPCEKPALEGVKAEVATAGVVL